MKSFNQIFFTLFILLSLGFCLSSCSADDKYSEPTPQTFLEKYDQSIWMFVDNENEVYFYFENNLNNPVIKYFKFYDCFQSSVYESPYFTIEENSTNTLTIKEFYSNDEYYTTIFSFSEGKMNRYETEFYHGSITTWDENLLISQRKPNSFTPICN